MSIRLKVIIGSTRPVRVGPAVGRWVDALAREHDAFDVELLDLASFELPLLDEVNHPAKQDYAHAHTKQWSAAIADADALVFVTPEYNYFAPAALVNAVQCLLREWKYKPAGVVSYGGISGGLRAAQELRQLIGNVGMVALPETVPLPMVFGHLEGEGDAQRLNATEPMVKGLHGMLDELAKWAGALKPIRA